MRRLLLLAPAAAIIAALVPGRAHAVDVEIAAQVLAGSRTITLATLTPMADVLRSASVNGELAVTVTETAVSGVDPWSVTVQLCGADNSGVKDCTNEANRLVLDGNSAVEIGGANLAISGRAVVPTLGGGTSTAVSGAEDFSAARTLFSNNGQSPLTLYSGTYAATATVSLTPPSGATAGAYSGFLVVTLVE